MLRWMQTHTADSSANERSIGDERPGVGTRLTLALFDRPEHHTTNVLTLREFLDWCTFLRQVANRVVTRVENGSWRKIDLRSRLNLAPFRNFIESCGGQFDAIDEQLGIEAFDEIDDYL